jgi:NAD(P)-dependent dehydrogenase (short-subunit alcohol dehydrogenase family)
MTDGELDGRVAIITGAGAQGQGIGNKRAAAALLARAGARTVLVDLDADLLTHKTSTLMAISRVCPSR